MALVRTHYLSHLCSFTTFFTQAFHSLRDSNCCVCCSRSFLPLRCLFASAYRFRKVRWHVQVFLARHSRLETRTMRTLKVQKLHINKNFSLWCIISCQSGGDRRPSSWLGRQRCRLPALQRPSGTQPHNLIKVSSDHLVQTAFTSFGTGCRIKPLPIDLSPPLCLVSSFLSSLSPLRVP